MITINIANDFSRTPGARYKTDGYFSGEEFREKLLCPKYLEAKQKGERLTVNFDGCYGFATSFLEESFGGMVREFKEKGLMDIVDIVSNDDVSIQGLIYSYVKKAEEEI